MINHSDLTSIEENVARRVLTYALSIAPIQTLEGEARQDAIAILLAVAAEIPEPGSRRVRSQSRNGTAITLADVGSAFSDDDRRALVALCDASSPAVASGLSRGSFPSGSVLSGMWREGEYS